MNYYDIKTIVQANRLKIDCLLNSKHLVIIEADRKLTD
jgi:hypothetical protein